MFNVLSQLFHTVLCEFRADSDGRDLKRCLLQCNLFEQVAAVSAIWVFERQLLS